jgi:hypothetical protein
LRMNLAFNLENASRRFWKIHNNRTMHKCLGTNMRLESHLGRQTK